MNVTGRLSQDGTFEIRGLPDLDWTVDAFVSTGDTQLQGEANGRPGSDLVVELSPVKPR